jgi:hypothetical protein
MAVHAKSNQDRSCEGYSMSEKQDSSHKTKLIWTGRIISALPALLLLASGTMKILKLEFVVHNLVHQFGYPEETILGIGIAEIASVVIYAVPQTAVLGAILMTGFLGGAVATHVRAGQPFFPPIIVGMLVWLGLHLRDGRLRALLPWRW